MKSKAKFRVVISGFVQEKAEVRGYTEIHCPSSVLVWLYSVGQVWSYGLQPVWTGKVSPFVSLLRKRS